MNKIAERGQESLTLKLVDSAVRREGSKAAKRAADLRKKNPGASTAKLVQLLDAQYRNLTVGTGAGAGAAAFVPGIGTMASLGVSAVEIGAFLNLTARYILTRAVLQDLDPQNFEDRRTLVMGVMLGKGGLAAGQQGGREWARNLAARRAAAGGAAQMQGTVVRSFVTKYLLRKGASVFGRALPFGVGAVIGGAANYATSRVVIEGAEEAFGTPAS